METQKLTFFHPDQNQQKSLYLAQEKISAGFPSPADDFKELRISIDQEVVRNEEATFYARVSGESMQGAGLDDGDLLVIDRSIEPKNGKIAVCYIDGEFTVKRIKKINNKMFLQPENKNHQAIEITESMDFELFGVVAHAIHHFI